MPLRVSRGYCRSTSGFVSIWAAANRNHGFDFLTLLHRSPILNLWALGIGVKHEARKGKMQNFSIKSPNFSPKLVIYEEEGLHPVPKIWSGNPRERNNPFDAIGSSYNPLDTSMLEVGLAF